MTIISDLPLWRQKEEAVLLPLEYLSLFFAIDRSLFVNVAFFHEKFKQGYGLLRAVSVHLRHLKSSIIIISCLPMILGPKIRLGRLSILSYKSA